MTISPSLKSQSVASSFYTSVSVIESNTALYTAAFLLQLAAVAWCILWVLACTFVLKETGPWFVLLFLISYLWVSIIMIVSCVCNFSNSHSAIVGFFESTGRRNL